MGSLESVWIKTFVAAVFTAGICTAAHADDFAQWRKDRTGKFSAFQAAHPNQEGEVAQVKILTAKAIAAHPDKGDLSKSSSAIQKAPGLQADPELDRSPVVWRTTQSPRIIWDSPDAPPMVVVPAGAFTMGSPTSEPNHQADESPRHRVRIGYALAVSEFPITYAEFAEFVADSRYAAFGSCSTVEGGKFVEQSERGWSNPGFSQTPENPAVCVNFSDATAYAAWVSKKTGHTYRLLSESEYEYVTRAGTTTSYWWGDNGDVACTYSNGADLDGKAKFPNLIAANCHDGSAFTSPVGSYAPNAFGLYDVTGNVWSWTADCWNATYINAPTDGSANLGGDCTQRVFRGGSWINGPKFLRTAYRDSGGSSDRSYVLGFRLARTL